MNNKQLLCARVSISVLVLSSIFTIAIIIGPQFLQTSESIHYDYYDYQLEAEYPNFTSITCSEEFEGYCHNGGLCFYLEEEETAACICTANYSGKRCDKYLWYHWAMKKFAIQCSIENIKRLEQQKCMSCNVFTNDYYINFRAYVLALCHEMVPEEKTFQLKNKIRVPAFNRLYKSLKVYRLAIIIHEATRITAKNYEKISTKDFECCPHQYQNPSFFACFLLAIRIRQSFTEDFNLLNC